MGGQLLQAFFPTWFLWYCSIHALEVRRYQGPRNPVCCSQHFQRKAGINNPWHKCENYRSEDRNKSCQSLLGEKFTEQLLWQWRSESEPCKLPRCWRDSLPLLRKLQSELQQAWQSLWKTSIFPWPVCGYFVLTLSLSPTNSFPLNLFPSIQTPFLWSQSDVSNCSRLLSRAPTETAPHHCLAHGTG